MCPAQPQNTMKTTYHGLMSSSITRKIFSETLLVILVRFTPSILDIKCMNYLKSEPFIRIVLVLQGVDRDSENMAIWGYFHLFRILISLINCLI